MTRDDHERPAPAAAHAPAEEPAADLALAEGPLLIGDDEGGGALGLPGDQEAWREAPLPPDHRSGLVTLIGRPNAGKSTLLNALLGEKLAIVSAKPQTTRDLIRGYLTTADAQVVFIDTPGLHEPKKGALLNRALVGVAVEALDQVDLVLLVVDAVATSRALGPQPLPADARGVVAPLSEAQALERCHRGDRRIVERLQRHGAAPVVVLNKRDLIRPGQLLPLMAIYGALPGVRAVLPVSARHGEGLEQLLAAVREALPQGPRLVDPELLTDRSERFLCAELLREALFAALREEVPYRLAVQVESFKEALGQVHIHCVVFVERPTQRAILLGKGGAMMRAVATAARLEMAAMLGRSVFLEVFVRVEPRWTERLETLRRFGYGATHEEEL